MKYVTADNSIRIIFAIIACALVFSWTTNTASAQENGSALTIAPTGQVIVKDAVVTSVRGNTIMAQTVWGSATISFTINTTGSTRFVPTIGSIEALKAMKVGNTISFSGSLTGSFTSPTVDATVVKDTTLLERSASVLGTVSSVDEGNGIFTIESEGERTSIIVPPTALMSLDGGYATVRDIEAGASAKVVGSMDISSRTITAQRVTIVTSSDPTEIAEPGETSGPIEEGVSEGIESPGVISSILNWLKGSRGMLSIR